MKLTKEQLKSIIKEELGKIMDEKIELGNYKDRVDKAAAEKELKKKRAVRNSTRKERSNSPRMLKQNTIIKCG